ncbi:MAG: ThuA domain-containing protein [Limisphaerales bacterium]
MNLLASADSRLMNRREMILRTGAAVAGLSLTGCAWPRSKAGAKIKKVLFFSKSSGYEHSVIKRNGNELSFAEKILADLGPKHGIEFVFSKDGSLFAPEYLAQFDAYLFYTTGDLTNSGEDKNPPMTPAGKAALLAAIENGKGFIGIHSATDTFHTPKSSPTGLYDSYIQMLGGEFIVHGQQQKAKLRLVDMKFPGFQNAGMEIELMEEWYSLKNFADDLHILLVQEPGGMTGAPYQRAPYPSTWARMHGKGRVFYTAMGHREDVWTNPLFRKFFLAASHGRFAT